MYNLIKKRVALLIFTYLLTCLFVTSAYSNNCDCENSSLYGTNIRAKFKLGTQSERQILVTNVIELPKSNADLVPNSSGFYRWDIDIKEQSILIKFHTNYSSGASTFGGTAITTDYAVFQFEDLYPLPAPTAGACKIIGMDIVSNRPNTNQWINQQSSFLDHSVNIPVKQNGISTRWENNQWIKINLKFGCPLSVQKGMTWGFAGLSDVWTKSGGIWSQACPSKLYHAPYAKLACETFPVNSSQSNYCGMDFSIYQPNATSHILRSPPDPQDTSKYVKKCDPYQGDTECSEKRRVLCVAKYNNPYFNRLPPYDDSSAGYPNYWSSSKPFPYERPRYKIHAASIGNQPAEFSEGWVGQFVKLSRHKIKGTDLSNVAAGNTACGVGWRMASFDDGKWVQGMGLNTAYGNAWDPAAPKKSGGWAFHATLAPDANIGWGHPGDSGRNARKNFFFERYWVNTPHGGNCWD